MATGLRARWAKPLGQELPGSRAHRWEPGGVCRANALRSATQTCDAPRRRWALLAVVIVVTSVLLRRLHGEHTPEDPRVDGAKALHRCAYPCFWGLARSGDEKRAVDHRGEHGGVGDGQQRGGVDNDHVIAVLQAFEQERHVARAEQLTGVGRDEAARQHVHVIGPPPLQHLVEIGLTGEHIGQADSSLEAEHSATRVGAGRPRRAAPVARRRRTTKPG